MLLQDPDDLLFREAAAPHVLVLSIGQNELQAGLSQRGNVSAHCRSKALFAASPITRVSLPHMTQSGGPNGVRNVGRHEGRHALCGAQLMELWQMCRPGPISESARALSTSESAMDQARRRGLVHVGIWGVERGRRRRACGKPLGPSCHRPAIASQRRGPRNT